MPCEAELKVKYIILHDDLSAEYYDKREMSKADFDSQHAQIWADMKAELIAEGYLVEPEKPVDLAALVSEVERLRKIVEGV